MLAILWNLTAFTIAMGVLIIVHEFGHFFVARCCGVQVKRFSIGFGKALWKYTDRKGTEYSVAPILLGGYIKMPNEHVKTIKSEARFCTFKEKKVWQRAAIIIAGPIANFIFSILAYWLVFMAIVVDVRPVVGKIIPGSIAENAQIIPGMEIKAVDGIEMSNWTDIRLQLSSKVDADSMVISVIPFGSNQQQNKVFNLHHWDFKTNKKEDLLKSLGICPMNIHIDPVLTEVKTGSSANKAGLQPGDKIIKINGKPLVKWENFVDLILHNPETTLDLGIKRRECFFSAMLIPDPTGSNNIEGYIGIVPKVIYFPERYDTKRWNNPFISIIEATNKTWQLMKLTIKILGKLIVGNIKLDNLKGPISIAREAGISAEFGVIYYIMFLAFVSVNLGIMNLLPLPILDGGNLFFLIIEKLKGSLSEKTKDLCYRISVIFLILLIGIALFNDFSRL